MASIALLLLAGSAPALDPYLRVGATAVYSKAAIRDADDEIDASSLAFESEAGLDLEWDGSEINVEVDADYVDFDNDDFTDRWRYRARLQWEKELGDDFELRLRTEGSWNTPSVEYFDIDELELRARLEYEPVRAHRLRGEFRWRERSYDDGSGLDGSGPRIELGYRHRFRAYHYLEAEGRYEEIDSPSQRRRYSRWAGAVTYTHPLADDLRVRPKLAYRITDFPGRDAPGAAFRRDRQWTPEVEFLWWPGDWRMSAEFQYRERSSSDPDRDRRGPRVEVKAAYVF